MSLKRFYHLLVVLLVLSAVEGVGFPRSVQAVDCSRNPGGSITISSSCTFPATVDGADAGTGTSNTADIAVSGSATLTIGSGQTISTGTLTPSGGSIAVISGGQIKIGSPLWMYDADGDGYPKESTMAAQATAEAGWRRRNLMTSLTQRDCQDFYNSGYGCVPASNDLTNGTYSGAYQEAAGNPAQGYRELPADINTVGLWHMNESSGTTAVADSSTVANNGTSSSSTNVGAGRLNNGRTFDGSTDRISASANSSYVFRTGNFTIEQWVYVAQAADVVANTGLVSTYLAASPSWWTELQPGASKTYGFYDTVAHQDSGVAIKYGEWVHFAVVRYGTGTNQAKMFINGSEVYSWTSATNFTANNTLWFGNPNYTAYPTSYRFKGTLDEVRISNVARTPEEIKADAQRRPYAVYTAPVNDLGQTPGSWSGMTVKGKGIRTGDGETLASATSLVAQWNFNATSGTSATNDAGAGTCGGTASNCNLTLANFASTASQDQAAGTGWTANNKRWGAGGLSISGVATADLLSVANPASDALDPNSADLTFETWIKTTDVSAEIFSNNNNNTTSCTNNGYRVGIDASGYPTFYLDTNGATAGCDAQISTGITTKINDGAWHHLAVSVTRGTSALMYLDGVQISSDTSVTSYASITVTGTVYMGGSAGGLDATLDSTHIYSRALTAAEILANYQAGQIEFQTRSSADNATWEAWRPVTNETAIANMDADQANWFWDMRRNAANTAWEEGSTATYMPKSKADDSTTKIEGTGSLKATIGAPQVDSNTTALWHLDETSTGNTDIKDSTANANNSTTVSGTTSVDGFFDKAKSFNGSSDYIEANDAASLDLTTNGTIEAWIKTSTNKANNWFLCKNGNYCLGVNATGALLFTGASAQDNAGTSLLAGQWHHIAVTDNNTTATYYVDGAASGTADAAAWGSTLTNTLRIGRDGGTNYFSGAIDEVKISNVVRSADEIAEAYRAGRDHRITKTISAADLSAKTKLPFYIAADRPGTYLSATIGESAYANYEPDANTIGLWHLEETSGTGAYLKDSSGNNNNATAPSCTVGASCGSDPTTCTKLVYNATCACVTQNKTNGTDCGSYNSGTYCNVNGCGDQDQSCYYYYPRTCSNGTCVSGATQGPYCNCCGGWPPYWCGPSRPACGT